MSALPTGRALLDPVAILSQSGLTLDMQYADFGAGTLGHFVFPATDIVGIGGHVYAVDILKGALQGIESRARLEQVTNLTSVWGDIERKRGVNIPEASLDVVSLINVSTLIMSGSAVLIESMRLLKPNGKLLLVDWKPGDEPVGPPPDKRPKQVDVQKMVEQAGFRFIKTFDAGPYHWGALYKGLPE